jgi:hypothetical protein
MRKGQSQVKKKADAVLARTDAFNFIWRANATKECFAFLECKAFRWALPEKQAAAKQTFVFHTLLTSKHSAKRTKERCKRGFASRQPPTKERNHGTAVIYFYEGQQ